MGKRCNNAIPPCRVEFSIPGVEIVGQGPGIKLIAFPVCGLENKFHRVENVGQGSGIIICIIFPLYGLENKFQCLGIDIFMPETDKFRAILRLQVVFFAVYMVYL